MSILQRDHPQSTEFLSESQPYLLLNNNSIDTWSSIDHYPASESGNYGHHGIVQTVSVNQAVTATPHPSSSVNALFYAYQDNATLGPLQYTKGPIAASAIQTPLTCLQSPAAGIDLAGGSTEDILDFAALQYCYGLVYVSGTLTSGVFIRSLLLLYEFSWIPSLPGAKLTVKPIVSDAAVDLIIVGSIMKINNVSAFVGHSIAWTLEFRRILNPT